MFRPLEFLPPVRRMRFHPAGFVLFGFAIAGFLFFVTAGNSGAQGSNSYIVVDANQKKILMEGDADKKRPVASLTKVATVIVAMDWMDSHGGDKTDVMVVPGSAGQLGGANPLGMKPGDRVSVRDALYGAMLASDNVSAETLASHFGAQMMSRAGGQHPIGVFVDQMNALAHNLGMARTRFVNPHGLDHAGPVGLSTARDMARLTIYGLRNPSFNFIVSQPAREIVYTRGGQSFSFKVKNTNKLLGQFGIDGVKTGSTQRAGDCLITSARKKDRFVPIDGQRQRRIAYRLVTVTLGSPDRFGQTSQLIQQGWSAYESWLAGGMIVRDRAELLTIAE
ncbi:MAG: D-alanyl-D-alanine carboxypeptidase [Akkermansiaceae bacterium]|nr:D-alanyl-D-alanine carboxypeptidase [Akkermansiaceae bacterium]